MMFRGQSTAPSIPSASPSPSRSPTPDPTTPRARSMDIDGINPILPSAAHVLDDPPTETAVAARLRTSDPYHLTKAMYPANTVRLKV
jgi:hypothetical protein